MCKEGNKSEYRKAIREKLGLKPKKLTHKTKKPSTKNNTNEKLVSIEIQKEFDVLDKSWEKKLL